MRGRKEEEEIVPAQGSFSSPPSENFLFSSFPLSANLVMLYFGEPRLGIV